MSEYTKAERDSYRSTMAGMAATAWLAGTDLGNGLVIGTRVEVVDFDGCGFLDESAFESGYVIGFDDDLMPVVAYDSGVVGAADADQVRMRFDLPGLDDAAVDEAIGRAPAWMTL